MADSEEMKKLEEQLKVIQDNLAQIEKEFEAEPRIKRQIVDNLKHQERILKEAIDEIKGE